MGSSAKCAVRIRVPARAQKLQPRSPLRRFARIGAVRWTRGLTMMSGKTGSRAGFEPATNRLTAGCSTTELRGTGSHMSGVPIANRFLVCKAQRPKKIRRAVLPFCSQFRFPVRICQTRQPDPRISDPMHLPPEPETERVDAAPPRRSVNIFGKTLHLPQSRRHAGRHRRSADPGRRSGFPSDPRVLDASARSARAVLRVRDGATLASALDSLVAFAQARRGQADRR